MNNNEKPSPKFRVNMADGTYRMVYRGYFVACLFLENPDKYTQVKFKDGDLSNANVENLEWVKSGGDVDMWGKVGSRNKKRDEWIKRGCPMGDD